MSASNWDSSGDVLQGIAGRQITSTTPSQAELSSDSLTSSELTLGDPASFLGLQFGADPGVLPHHHAPSILNQYLPQHKQSSSSTPHQLDYSSYHHPRLTNSSQDAWNPLQVTGVPANSSAFPMLHMGKSHHMYGYDRRYSSGHYSTPSENGSQYNGLHSSDSGYSTQSCTTRSIAASYAMDSACSPYLAPQDYEQEDKVSALDLSSNHYNEPIDAGDNPESPSILCHEAIKCDYPNCQWTGKCPSDKRKHEARHKKLFKCDEPGCTRKEGFGTINDLARHKKCVHKQEPERGPKVLYMCFGHNCPRRNKKWPRLDNFRQHLARMHNDEDIDGLLKRSHDWYETCVKPQEMASSFVDRFSEEATALQTQHAPEPENTPIDVDQEPYHSIVASQTLFPSSEMLTVDSIKKLEEEHEDQGIEAVPAQPMELPTLKSLNLEPVLEQKASTAQRENTRNDKMEEVIEKAAGNILHTLTKSINNTQRRHGQHLEDADDIAEQEGELSDWNREILQKILTRALERLQNPRPSNGNAPEPAETESDKKGWIQCESCPKRTRLRCEMKKHKKRHERPYGCTFHRCNKTFGSKADWKRHENSQHFHLQSWRCTLPDTAHSSLSCARLYYRQELYVQHLKKHHQVEDKEVRVAICKNCIGRNGESQFWCGFCQDIIPMRSQGLAATNERFNHIDIEHFKKGERIGNWLLPSGHLTKDREREEKKRMMENGNGDDSEPIGDDNSDEESICSSDHSDIEGMHEDAIAADQDMVQEQPFGQADDSYSRPPRAPFTEPANSRKRKLPSHHPALDSYQHGEGEASNVEKRTRVQPSNSRSNHTQPQSFDAYGHDGLQRNNLYPVHVQRSESVSCCQCTNGPFPLSYTGSCLYCQHSLCGNCASDNIPPALECQVGET